MEKKNLIIIHGVYSRRKRFGKLMDSLSDRYNVFYFDYSWRESLESQVNKLLNFIKEKDIKEADFITTSFGSILFRVFCSKNNCTISRVVEMAPLNQGSKVLEKAFKIKSVGKLFLGQICQDFLDKKEDILSIKLPDNIGVVAGNKRFSYVAPESFLIPFIVDCSGHDYDGKIFIDETKFVGMKDFFLINECHDRLDCNDIVIKKVNNFLDTGRFG